MSMCYCCIATIISHLVVVVTLNRHRLFHPAWCILAIDIGCFHWLWLNKTHEKKEMKKDDEEIVVPPHRICINSTTHLRPTDSAQRVSRRRALYSTNHDSNVTSSRFYNSFFLFLLVVVIMCESACGGRTWMASLYLRLTASAACTRWRWQGRRSTILLTTWTGWFMW